MMSSRPKRDKLDKRTGFAPEMAKGEMDVTKKGCYWWRESWFWSP
jgi:hypothetical protein